MTRPGPPVARVASHSANSGPTGMSLGGHGDSTPKASGDPTSSTEPPSCEQAHTDAMSRLMPILVRPAAAPRPGRSSSTRSSAASSQANDVRLLPGGDVLHQLLLMLHFPPSVLALGAVLLLHGVESTVCTFAVMADRALHALCKVVSKCMQSWMILWNVFCIRTWTQGSVFCITANMDPRLCLLVANNWP